MGARLFLGLTRFGGEERARGVLRAVAASIVACAMASSPALAKSHDAKPHERHEKIEASRFHAFIKSLWPEAEAHGVSRQTFDAAFAGVTFDSKIIALTNRQVELTKPIWDYIAGAVTPARVAQAKEKLEAYRLWLAKAGRDYGVEPAIVIGIWGLETDFGGFAGSDNVIRSLATLAYAHYRGDYFKGELIAALQILQEGDIAAAQMKGSWAGAMGQTQFMPSSFLKYAVDFEGHGRRDIWGSAPDAIGSTANYLKQQGWRSDEPWGFEVQLPKDFALTAADFLGYAPFSAFAERGVTRADGGTMPQTGEAELLMPAGLRGPVFLVTSNFRVIKTYNNSTSYALAVALLGDRAIGGGQLIAAWPFHDHLLTMAQARDLQTRLKKMGYDVGEIDGKIGETGQNALRAFQERSGLTPDGYPTLALLQRLRKRP
ncbi:MAG TPA: lytic murein transglycosylase [Roseiarcus sp.]|nr:lytic murein transglycosylase [Roseiarcus sp.]